MTSQGWFLTPEKAIEARATEIQYVKDKEVWNKISRREAQAKDWTVIKTRWIDNTKALNFVESFASSDKIKAAKFKITLNVVKGYSGTREVSKITIYKRQLIEQDFLQGWKEQHSDGIMEKTILYRVDRKLWIDNKLKEIDKLKEQEQLNSF